MIYLDNAATSFPKPEGVYAAIDKALREYCGSPGRSRHSLSVSAARVIDETRILCARFFNAPTHERIIFTSNATAALNIAIKGLLEPGDHVITSSLEHNSVTRPLHSLEKDRVGVSKLPYDLTGGLDPADIKKALRPSTKLVVCSHISNVTGTLNDLPSIGAFCKEHGLVFLADAAQSAGVHPIDVRHVDMLAFSGHKGLFGPQGTGGLYVRRGIKLKTIMQGGTGKYSELLSQPENMPEGFESGTPNTPGIAGLGAGIRFIQEKGMDAIMERESALINKLTDGIAGIKGIELIGPSAKHRRGNVVSVCFEKIFPAEAALTMETAFNIAVRSGLHCAVDAHRSLGTFEKGGTLRISPNFFNTEKDIVLCLTALDSCAGGG